MNLDNYPLSWPQGRPRTQGREKARFSVLNGNRNRQELTRYAALNRLTEELRRLETTDVVISTNVPARRDGLPYSAAKEPNDPGVAVYFRLEGVAHCLACDKWNSVADNMAAIAAHIFAIRGQSRWGVGDLQQAFAGYRALPAMPARVPWFVTLGFVEPPESLAVVKTRWLKLLQKYHPDLAGGDSNRTAEINAAFQEAERYYIKQSPKRVMDFEDVVTAPSQVQKPKMSLADRFKSGAR